MMTKRVEYNGYVAKGIECLCISMLDAYVVLSPLTRKRGSKSPRQCSQLPKLCADGLKAQYAMNSHATSQCTRHCPDASRHLGGGRTYGIRRTVAYRVYGTLLQEHRIDNELCPRLASWLRAPQFRNATACPLASPMDVSAHDQSSRSTVSVSRGVSFLNAAQYLLFLRLDRALPVSPVPVTQWRGDQQKASEDKEDGIVGVPWLLFLEGRMGDRRRMLRNLRRRGLLVLERL